ncbi:MAG TPA: shikimate dehydrogenase [Pirellulaceae bacterium]|nr:shikimate dehydrogenase [Pirellulaceae bacterium]
MSLICVSIGRGRHRAMIAEHKHLAEQGVQLVELRLDFILTPVNLKRLLGERPCPVVVTLRRQRDGGRWSKPEEERMMILRQAIAAGVEYVDLEEDIAGNIPRFGKTKRIISYHNFQETPENLPALHSKMAAMDADIVKIATMAHSPHDYLKLLRIMRYSRVPTIGICMGDIGTPSRILCAKFGSPFTYASFHAERMLAPGQLTWQQMKDVYHYEQITPETEIFGVIADPVAHSFSPLIHNAAFLHAKMNRVYVPFRVPREELPQFMHDCRELGVKGLSVTIPHKEEILHHVHKIDEASQEVGASNTVVWKEDEPLGFNTDYRAAMASIDRLLTGAGGESTSITGKTALVLGAGGVARPIVYGLKKRGADVVIANRTPERADDMATRFQCRSVAWSLRHTIKPDLLVNCTPVGMHPNMDESPFPAMYLRAGMFVFDTIYNPEQTLLIKEARENACETVTGVEMFVSQAAHQFRLFTGEEAPVEVMRQSFRRAISAAKV